MSSKPLYALALFASLAATSHTCAEEPEASPAIRIRLSHPDRELEELLRLFQGSKASSPAAALAAWKRAAREPNRLGKPMEALIAALNPRMIDDLRTIDAAEVSIRFQPTTGLAEWSAVLPEDDGTFAALASALVLSGGMAEAPIEGLAVDRLAGPGSPLMARVKEATLLASDRENLKLARTRAKATPKSGTTGKAENGLEVLLESGSLKSSKSVAIRRLAELIAPAEGNPPGAGSAQARLSLEDKVLKVSLTGLLTGPASNLSIDPSWFDSTPRNRAISSFALATDPAPKSWEALYALADRIEKLDPARKDVAPLQIRLAVLARVIGLRLDSDLLYHLRGISGWVGSSDGTRINNALMVFHLEDATVAERIVASIKPMPGTAKAPAGGPDHSRWLGLIDGQPLRIVRSNREVALAWGEDVLEASSRASADPERSSGDEIRNRLKSNPKSLGGGMIWPERMPGLGLEVEARKAGDAAIPPICWSVVPTTGTNLSVFLEWDGIDETVHRFLERLTLDPPPDR